jgi:hypothetical protein
LGGHGDFGFWILDFRLSRVRFRLCIDRKLSLDVFIIGDLMRGLL